MEKIIVLWLIALGLLSGCTTDRQVDLTSQKETIWAVFVANNNIYAVGDLYSYQFSLERFSDTEKLINYLNSDFMKAVETVSLSQIRQDVSEKSSPPELDVTVNFQLNKPKLLKVLHKEAEADSYADNLIDHFYLRNGKLIELQNKDEILAKNRLKQPLTMEFVQYSYESQYDAEKIGRAHV